MIPLTRPLLGEEEEAAVAAVLRTGMLVQGARVLEFEQRLAAHTGRKHAIVVSNGTSAIELALAALGVGPARRTPSSRARRSRCCATWILRSGTRGRASSLRV